MPKPVFRAGPVPSPDAIVLHCGHICVVVPSNAAAQIELELFAEARPRAATMALFMPGESANAMLAQLADILQLEIFAADAQAVARALDVEVHA